VIRILFAVLSGTGSDGAAGIRDVSKNGGVVFAQSAETAGFDGMPRAAMQSGAVDIALAPRDIPQRLIEYYLRRDRSVLQRPMETDSPVGESAMFRIIRMFRLKYGVDFSLYKPATITRRLERRVQLAGVVDLNEYNQLLDDNPEEADNLFRDLLVEVTEFFRDPDAFENLRRKILPELVGKSDPREELRAWVPGCATGEEAYSMAILLQEAIEMKGRSQDFKVFATDVHRNSLETASTAVYPASSLAKVPVDFASRYFTQSNGLCHVKRDLRQKVIFAASDLTSDPPFTRIDVISCRNVLIYLEPKVQERILSLFHFGLKVGGILFLGPSETVGVLGKEFETVDRHWRIYSKHRDVRLPGAARMPIAPVLQSVVHERQPTFVSAAIPGRGKQKQFIASAAEDLLSRYVPPSLLINDSNELVYTFGDARHILVQPEGAPTLDALKMLPNELRSAVVAGLHRARQEGRPVVFSSIELQVGDETTTNEVRVEPYAHTNEGLFLVCIEPHEKPQGEKEVILQDYRNEDFSNERVAQLERELSYTRETLQATVEELESSNEELQATNEELIASNEELQSTNEELHSVNEELFTVNSEHKQKIDELTELTEDMDNLLKSTDIGTIFLDRGLNIRMFTPAISSAFNVLDQDIGRPIGHIAYKLDSPNLISDVTEVLNTRLPKEIEVQSHEGRVFLQRIQPYRTSEENVEGIVLTTTDISALKEAERAQREMMTLQQINEELPDFAFAVSHDLQAPLRHINQYSEILQCAVRESQQDTITKATEVINRSASNLRDMIEALLQYSRVNTRGQPLGNVSLNDAVDSATMDLYSSVKFHKAHINASPMPDVQGDMEQLRSVFYHLIDNALKFRSEEKPEIEIKAEPENGGHILVRVKDNGIGIDDRHCQQVFTIFKRMGQKNDAPGLGVGLALTKRIILRHGGRIWLDSNEGHGTTVCFTLRKRQE
jgi:two-component system CheB/CheR fusion protein